MNIDKAIGKLLGEESDPVKIQQIDLKLAKLKLVYLNYVYRAAKSIVADVNGVDKTSIDALKALPNSFYATYLHLNVALKYLSDADLIVFDWKQGRVNRLLLNSVKAKAVDFNNPKEVEKLILLFLNYYLDTIEDQTKEFDTNEA